MFRFCNLKSNIIRERATSISYYRRLRIPYLFTWMQCCLLLKKKKKPDQWSDEKTNEHCHRTSKHMVYVIKKKRREKRTWLFITFGLQNVRYLDFIFNIIRERAGNGQTNDKKKVLLQSTAVLHDADNNYKIKMQHFRSIFSIKVHILILRTNEFIKNVMEQYSLILSYYYKNLMCLFQGPRVYL